MKKPVQAHMVKLRKAVRIVGPQQFKAAKHFGVSQGALSRYMTGRQPNIPKSIRVMADLAIEGAAND